MWTYNHSELYHYGVLGMKWGVRRYQNKDGTLTAAGKKRQKKFEASVSEYKKQGDTAKQAEAKAIHDLGAERALKTLAIVGGITLAAAGVIVAKNAYKFRVDKVIKAGTKIQRITGTPDEFLNRPFYAAFKKSDMLKYKKIYGTQINGRMTLLGDKYSAHKIQLTAYKDIKVASQKKAIEVFDTLYKKDPEFREWLGASNGNVNIKKKYEAFNRSLVGTMPFPPQSERRKFYNALKKMGYDAVEDINDIKYSGYKAKAPVILFNNDKLTNKKVEKLSTDEIKRGRAAVYGMMVAENTATNPVAAVAVTVGAANKSSDYAKINQYKELHPNTKLSNRQILKMLEESD